MNRRFIALAMTGALSLAVLAGCSGGTDTPPETTPPAITDPVTPPTDTPNLPPEETAPPETTPPAETPSAPPSQKPVTTPPTTDKPPVTPPPAEKPVTPAPPAKPETAVVQSVWDEIAKLEIPSLSDVDADTMATLYGISAADVEEFICKMPLVSVQASEFFIAKVADGKMETVKAGILKRQADLDAQWSTYLPDQYELVQNYKLVTSGNYVIFAVSDVADKAVTAFHTYAK